MALTRSEDSATRNGISSTEEAYNGIRRVRQDVDGTRIDASSAFGGSDGAKYQDLLRQWDDQAQVISDNLRDVIEALNETSAENRRTQESQKEAVERRSAQSHAVFDALHG